MYLSDYSSSLTVIGGGNVFSRNQASFGAVFAGKGFVTLGEDTVVRYNLARTPTEALSSSSINFNTNDVVGFGAVYWFSGVKPPNQLPTTSNSFCR